MTVSSSSEGMIAVTEEQDRERLLDIWLGLTGQAPLPAGPLIMPVLSGSMRPTMPLGSRLLIRPASPDECRRGDVVVCIEGPKLVAHRAILFLGPRSWGWVFHKGDANRHGNLAPCRLVKGVVEKVLPPADPASQPVGSETGVDPFSPEAASRGLRQVIRDLILAWPRAIRHALTGRAGKKGERP